MKKTAIFLTLVLLLFSCKEKAREMNASPLEVQVLENWFVAWELVSQEIFMLDRYQPVDFVFFDDERVYSTSRITIPEGNRLDGPSIFDQELEWRYKAHDGQLILPGGDEVPVGIMSFAAPLENQKNNTFFVMPLPSFWENAGVESKELPYQDFITGIFLHEFSHTQQMDTFGKEVSRMESKHQFAFDLTDNIVQDYFGKDSLYGKVYQQELSTIYGAIHSEEELLRKEIATTLELMNQRHNIHFTDSLEVLRPLDKLFLTMEGVGQYAMYAWLKHPKGGNLDSERALKGTRRGGWSQDEGLGLAVLLSKISPPKNWGNQIFGKESATLMNLLEKELDEKNGKHKSLKE